MYEWFQANLILAGVACVESVPVRDKQNQAVHVKEFFVFGPHEKWGESDLGHTKTEMRMQNHS